MSIVSHRPMYISTYYNVSNVLTTVVCHSYYLYLALSSKEDLFVKTSFDHIQRYDAQPIAILVLSTYWCMSQFAY